MQQATASHFIPKRILVPLDFSSSSDAALETASDLAQHFHAELYLVNVVAMLPMGTKMSLSRRQDIFTRQRTMRMDGWPLARQLSLPRGSRLVPVSRLEMTWLETSCW